MGELRPCKYCGGYHRKKSTAKKCAKKNMAKKPWSLSELGLKHSK